MTLASFRYPYPCADLEALRAEVERATIHGRLSLCEWVCLWLPGKPSVRWDEAVGMVDTTAQSVLLSGPYRKA